ncbi:MAG: molybdopterin-dependent oxidoreductase [Bryobacterales bacterium]|nr:molybdopterin-dependent oxidoreductase [Bryobacterales bacterium]
MDRRNFSKLVGTASGGAVSGACGRQAEEIIPLLVPEESVPLGAEQWHASVCGECGAACGTVARVMAAEREIEVGGDLVRQKIAAVKKLEGNPLDPVSGGRLCARGHASLQSLYNPDRLRGPLKRAGGRGEGRFEAISWDDAIAAAGAALAAADPSRILFLAKAREDVRSQNIARFLDALGAPPATSIGVGDLVPEHEASRRVFGRRGLPLYEIQDATLVLSIGADFLGGWASPVLYARRYGHMRQGRRELRGRLIHAESRFSLTAWNADRWLPVRPGGELALALAVGHVLVRDELGEAARSAPREVVSAFAGVDLGQAAAVAGVAVDSIRSTAADLARASAPVVLAGASVVRRNSADAVTAACALNWLLGCVGEPGGVLPPQEPIGGLARRRPFSADWSERLQQAALVLVDGVNPAYNAPATRSALAGAETIVSFSSFLDDTSAFADFILPDHDPLEQAAFGAPAVSPVPSVAVAGRFAAPLYESRSTSEVLGQLAAAAGRAFEELTVGGALDTLRATLETGEAGASSSEFQEAVLKAGGWQGLPAVSGPAQPGNLGPFQLGTRQEGVVFQAYESPQFGTGSGANRPWLQELPDPTSSALWGLPVEVDPATAARLGIGNGDKVRVRSEHGSLEAAVYVNPAAIPGVVSMALGQGHESYGRYAAGRGANPMAVVGDARDARTGCPAMGPTPVSVEKIEDGPDFVQFSRQDRDLPPHRS